MSRFTNRFSLDQRYTKICAYASVTVILTIAVCMILYAASPVFLTVWNLIRAVLEPLIYGAAITYVLNPLVKLVSGRLAKLSRFAEDDAKRRSVAVIISFAIAAIAILVIVLLLVLMVTHSLSSLNWASISELLGSSREDLMGTLRVLEGRLEEWGIISAGNESALMNTVSGFTRFAGSMVFAVIFAVYFLMDGRSVTNYIARIVRVVLGTISIDPSQAIADANFVFSRYFRGQGIDALVVFVMSGVLLTAVGVPYGLVIGLLAGLGNFIPYFGGPVGFISVVLMCLPGEQWDKMILGLIVMAIIMFIDGNIVNPKLLSSNIEVHPILVLVALIAGGAVGGIAGMLVAVPTIAWLKIQVDRWLVAQERAAAGTGATEEDELPLDGPQVTE